MKSVSVLRPQYALFALSLGVYAYFYQAGGWNQNVRFDLVRAIVERHTLTIDAYHGNTQDKALREGHYYSDKAPGISLLGVPVYALMHAIDNRARETDRYQALASYLCTVFAVGVPAALAVAALYVTALSWGTSAPIAAAGAVGYAFGTLAFPYATLLYGHQTAASLMLMGFSLVTRRRAERAANLWSDGLAGLLLGGAITVEYPAAIGVAAVLVYALAVTRPKRRWTALAAGFVIPLAGLAAYHTAAFGGPWTLAYGFSVQAPRHGGWFMGVGAPQLRAAYYLLVHEYRGLFVGSCWLSLAFPGAIAWWKQGRRAEVALCASVALVSLAMNVSLVDWHGGWSFGPRHLVTSLPFVALLALGVAAPGVVERWWRPVVLCVGTMGIAFSTFLMLAGTAVKPEVPRAIERPFQEFLLPAFFEGRLALNTQSIDMVTGRGYAQRRAWNVGELLGLRGLSALLPLAVYAMGAGLWLAYGLKGEAPANAELKD